MKTPPVYRTKTKAVAICGFENEDTKGAIKRIDKLLKSHPDNWLVIQFVLMEAMKMAKKRWIRFDLGTKKEWELKRLK